MSGNEPVDYEDLTSMKLDDDALHELLNAGGECIFNSVSYTHLTLPTNREV